MKLLVLRRLGKLLLGDLTVDILVLSFRKFLNMWACLEIITLKSLSLLVGK